MGIHPLFVRRQAVRRGWARGDVSHERACTWGAWVVWVLGGSVVGGCNQAIGRGGWFRRPNMRSGRVILIIAAITGAYVSGAASNRPAPQTRTAPELVTLPPVVATTTSLTPVQGFASLQVQRAVLPPTQSTRQTVSTEPSPPTPPPPKEAERPKLEKKTILTAAAIVALIVDASRSAYYSTGRPCACPDDRMRNGRRCGNQSAFSRPGGAAPKCYASDITAEMIEEYRKNKKR